MPHLSLSEHVPGLAEHQLPRDVRGHECPPFEHIGLSILLQIIRDPIHCLLCDYFDGVFPLDSKLRLAEGPGEHLSTLRML